MKRWTCCKSVGTKRGADLFGVALVSGRTAWMVSGNTRHHWEGRVRVLPRQEGEGHFSEQGLKFRADA